MHLARLRATVKGYCQSAASMWKKQVKTTQVKVHVATCIWFIIVSHLNYGPLQVNILLRTCSEKSIVLPSLAVCYQLANHCDGGEGEWRYWLLVARLATRWDSVCWKHDMHHWDGGLRARHSIAISCCSHFVLLCYFRGRGLAWVDLLPSPSHPPPSHSLHPPPPPPLLPPSSLLPRWGVD